jgi:hypothetical protein
MLGNAPPHEAVRVAPESEPVQRSSTAVFESKPGVMSSVCASVVVAANTQLPLPPLRVKYVKQSMGLLFE